jgi:predicted kinase
VDVQWKPFTLVHNIGKIHKYGRGNSLVRPLLGNTGGRDLATLHLMVGLPFSGKTTLARKLEQECSALRLTPDEWQVRLFGQDAKEPEHDSRHSLIEAMLWNIASRALELGTNVILDFGFWAREEREDFRLRAKKLGASSEVHFLDVPEDELMRRLEERNSQSSQESFYISAEMIKPWIAFFQKPTPDELVRRE